LFAAFCLLIAVASRFIHHDLIWVEEGYGLAAAAEVLRGKALYRDIWFDKPPLYAWFYLLCGAQGGWPLRLLGSLHLLAVAMSVKWTGQQIWGIREGLLAAALCCLSLTFWIPSAVMAVAPDLLMMVPHVLAVGFAVRGKPLLSGITAGIALLCNPRGLFVLIAAGFWTKGSRARLLIGFAAVQVLYAFLVPLNEYWLEVWAWGFVYSGATFIAQPLREALIRTGGWLAFHLAPTIGTAVHLFRERNWRVAAWLLLCFVAVSAGWRFFPRYYFHLLPVAALAGSRGLLLVPRRWRVAMLMLLLIPAVRFGPRYISLMLSGSAGWSDTAMMEDSREVAALLRRLGRPGSTLLVWGYRPDVYPFSGLPAGTRFLDSQPLTGVLADRHLTSADVLYPSVAARNRAELVRTLPDFIVDGLGPLNPQLAITQFADLRSWLRDYELIARTRMSLIYRLRPGRLPFRQER
jgi:hypothetical protein